MQVWYAHLFPLYNWLACELRQLICAQLGGLLTVHSICLLPLLTFPFCPLWLIQLSIGCFLSLATFNFQPPSLTAGKLQLNCSAAVHFSMWLKKWIAIVSHSQEANIDQTHTSHLKSTLFNSTQLHFFFKKLKKLNKLRLYKAVN